MHVRIFVLFDHNLLLHLNVHFPYPSVHLTDALSLHSYVMGESSVSKVMVLHGVQGCGKTTLLARAAQCCHSWLPDCAVVVRTVNLSPQSSTLEQLLRTITLQCSLIASGTQAWLTHVSLLTSSSE